MQPAELIQIAVIVMAEAINLSDCTATVKNDECATSVMWSHLSTSIILNHGQGTVQKVTYTTPCLSMPDIMVNLMLRPLLARRNPC